MSTGEKERGKCRLGAWLYHPLHSTKERDLGQHRVKERESEDWEPGSTIPYTLPRNGILASAREKERESEDWGPGSTIPLHSTEERDLGEQQREGTGRV